MNEEKGFEDRRIQKFRIIPPLFCPQLIFFVVVASVVSRLKNKEKLLFVFFNELKSYCCCCYIMEMFLFLFALF
jgi:hypothetical protein